MMGTDLKRFHRSFSVALGLTAALLLALPAGSAVAAKKTAKPSFFNTVEVQSTNLKPFKKWTSALGRYSKEVAKRKGAACKSTKFNKCHYDQWMDFLKSQLKTDPLAQIKAVNRYMNKSRYITDQNNWGQKDYWASLGEFMAKFGDCEDYAIAKFISLIKLGFKPEQLRVVAVKDLNLKVGHAILVVFLDGKTYVLDNQIKQVIEARSVRHYQPVFSINTKAWWRHRPA